MKLQLSDTTRLLVSLYAPAMVMSFGQGMVIPTIPALAETFGVTAGLAAQLVTASVVGRTVALVPVGSFVDRVGRRPLLIGGPLLIASAAALTAVAPVFALLLVTQFLSGVGSSAWQVAREITAVDVVRPEQRGRMMSGFMGMNSVGTALGPVLGGVVTDLFDFRAVFWVYAFMGLCTLAVSLGVPETARRQDRTPRRRLDIGRVSEVEPYFRTTYVVLICNSFVAAMRHAIIASIVPLYLGLQLGYSPTQVGTLFGIYGVVNLLMIGPTGVLSDSRGRKAVVIPSTYLAVLAFVGFPFADNLPQLAVLLVLTGVATGLALGTMATYTYDVIPEHARGRLQTLRRLVADGGALLGPALGGLIADLSSPGMVFWAFAPLQLAAGLLITFFARESLHHVRERAREVAPPS